MPDFPPNFFFCLLYSLGFRAKGLGLFLGFGEKSDFFFFEKNSVWIPTIPCPGQHTIRRPSLILGMELSSMPRRTTPSLLSHSVDLARFNSDERRVPGRMSSVQAGLQPSPHPSPGPSGASRLGQHSTPRDASTRACCRHGQSTPLASIMLNPSASPLCGVDRGPRACPRVLLSLLSLSARDSLSLAPSLQPATGSRPSRRQPAEPTAAIASARYRAARDPAAPSRSESMVGGQ
jgi:hypothetical protein